MCDIISGNGLKPNRHQVIICTNYDIVYWRISMSLGMYNLRFRLSIASNDNKPQSQWLLIHKGKLSNFLKSWWDLSDVLVSKSRGNNWGEPGRNDI